ncbi:MAG: hypothetical protein ACO3JL_13815 [Myxococcota bacterium]
MGLHPRPLICFLASRRLLGAVMLLVTAGCDDRPLQPEGPAQTPASDGSAACDVESELFANHCVGCHSAGGTPPVLTAGSARNLVGELAADGETPYVVPGDPEESLLYRKVAGTQGPDEGGRMPPGAPLDDGSVDLLARWIRDGAAACGDEPRGDGADDDASGGGRPSDDGELTTWHEDVAPVVMEHCASCHRPDAVGPFSLLSYDEAKPWASALAAATASRRMPPIPADASGACNTFSNVRWLSQSELQVFADWVADGTPAGDDSATPAVPPVGGTLPGANRTVAMAAAYTPQGLDDYRCFVLDPGLTSREYLTGYQVKPGDPRVVHHVILYAPDTDDASARAVSLDDETAGLGYPCFGGAGVAASTVGIWAPGSPALEHPSGTGLPLAGNRKLVLQVHYNTAAGSFADLTTVELRTTSSVDKPAELFLLANTDFALPPGQPEVVVTAQATLPPFPGTIELWALYPHMHKRGRTLTLNIDEQCAVDVPLWDFNWQHAYFFEEPMAVVGGQTITLTCSYDTSSANAVVRHGEGSEDEMCLAFAYIVR